MPTGLYLAAVCIKLSMSQSFPLQELLLTKKETQTQINLLGEEVQAAESILVYYHQDLPRKAPELAALAAHPSRDAGMGGAPAVLSHPPKKTQQPHPYQHKRSALRCSLISGDQLAA